MEPDVIRMYSSSPPPMEDGAEEEDDEFGDFGTFASVPNSVSFSEFDTPTTFNQSQALDATSPPELINNRGGVVAFNHSSSNGTHDPTNELSKANGVLSSSPSDRTDIKKVLSSSVDLSAPVDCNGGGTEVLTNGFATFDIQGSPSSQNSVHSHTKEISTEDVGSVPEGDFADFAAFSNAGEHLSQREDSNNPTVPQQVAVHHDEDCDAEQESTSADNGRDTNRTGPNTSGAETPDGSCNTDRGSRQRDSVCTNEPLTLNGLDAADGEESKDDVSASVDGDAGPVDEEKGSGNDTETETETETSFGRPLSTDALEEYGDVSTTGSAPSPPLHGDTATPADEDDEDFGDFGDASVFSGQSFADFDQLDVQQDQNKSQSPAPAQESSDAEQDDDFGDFNSPKFHSRGNEGEDEEKFADFPVSDSFGNFSSAEGGEADAGWSAFGEQQQEDVEGEGESWAAFTDESVAVPAERSEEEEEEEEDWHESETAAVSEETSRTDRQTASLSVRLEKLFQSSFPPTDVPPLEDAVLSLKVLLEPPEDEAQSGAEAQRRCRGGGVWTQLQDIHEAFGLRYQWGGSHCNKALLCCLGIDTRNILFTGQKKQPVIVPMYAAGLGMLEPTKEPVKPVSAAEMIASIGQAPPPAPEKSSCPPDTVQQEALPPVQFDWSSSGLTNPLDGVDPELFELTTAKMDASGSGSRVADAFARLMSTMEKTSTSTRKPKKDENLSEEASKVIAALPDLSFMQAKVLMFPATLTPLGSQATPD